MNNKESISKLEKFNELINDYFEGNYTNVREIKTEINHILPIVQDLVFKAGCLKTMSMAPPPAIGGMVMQNFNPFDMIFESLWGTSIIPNISDMIEQAIGKYKHNLVDGKAQVKKEQREVHNIDYPNKITFGWLIDYVPIKIWIFSGTALVAFFVLGYKIGVGI